MKRLFLFVLLMLSLVFTLSYADSYRQGKVCNELYESQIRAAKMFLDTIEVNAQEAKMKLKILGSFLEQAKNGSDPEIIKAIEKSLERRKIQIVNYKNAIRTAKLHVKAAKVGNVVFDKIAKNYIACNGSGYAKYEDNSNIKTANINDGCDEFFNCQVKANEILLNFFQECLKHVKNDLKQQEEYKSIENHQPANPRYEKINLRISEANIRLIEAKVELAKSCLKAAKKQNIVFEEIAKILPQNNSFTVFSICYTSEMKEKLGSFYSERISRFLKGKLNDSKNEIELLQSYIKQVESGTKSNAEMIDVLKARLKVHEIQLDIYKLCEEEIGRLKNP
ncbi:MAG: hypothetical protein LBV62_04045 [Rickettsiales bacterium]|jgi:hypothetical protein|nr:hypothetical protein [Rickettsiales bacterium]